MFIRWSQFSGLSAAIAFGAPPGQPSSEVRFVPHDTNDGFWPRAASRNEHTQRRPRLTAIGGTRPATADPATFDFVRID